MDLQDVFLFDHESLWLWFFKLFTFLTPTAGLWFGGEITRSGIAYISRKFRKAESSKWWGCSWDQGKFANNSEYYKFIGQSLFSIVTWLVSNIKEYVTNYNHVVEKTVWIGVEIAGCAFV